METYEENPRVKNVLILFPIYHGLWFLTVENEGL